MMSDAADPIVLSPRDTNTSIIHSPLLGQINSFPENLQRALVGVVAKAQDLIPILLQILKDQTSPEKKQILRVVFPPRALEALEQGEWHFLEANDGSGFLPTLVDANNKFVCQIRLRPEEVTTLKTTDLHYLANAAAHARTHALLQQLLKKLEVIEQKLSLVLQNQRAKWQGQILAGVEQYKYAMKNNSSQAEKAVFICNACQSLLEGRITGMLQLHQYMASMSPLPSVWWKQFLPRRSAVLRNPSEEQAEYIDRVYEDLLCLYGAIRTEVAIHIEADRPKCIYR